MLICSSNTQLQIKSNFSPSQTLLLVCFEWSGLDPVSPCLGLELDSVSPSLGLVSASIHLGLGLGCLDYNTVPWS